MIVGRRYWILIWYGILLLGVLGMVASLHWGRRRLLSCLGKPESLISFVRDRPGHDRRYAMDTTLIRTELGWRPRHDFGRGLEDTVQWYLANEAWWRRVLSEAYRAAGAY